MIDMIKPSAPPPPPAPNLDLTALTLPELYQNLAAVEREIAVAKISLGAIQAEFGRRFTDKVKEAYVTAKKTHGVVHVDIGDGFQADGDAKQTVTWDTEKLIDVSKEMTWEQARKLFKIELSVSERTYGALEAANPDLFAKIKAARTTKIGDPKLTIVKAA